MNNLISALPGFCKDGRTGMLATQTMAEALHQAAPMATKTRSCTLNPTHGMDAPYDFL